MNVSNAFNTCKKTLATLIFSSRILFREIFKCLQHIWLWPSWSFYRDYHLGRFSNADFQMPSAHLILATLIFLSRISFREIFNCLQHIWLWPSWSFYRDYHLGRFSNADFQMPSAHKILPTLIFLSRISFREIFKCLQHIWLWPPLSFCQDFHGRRFSNAGIIYQIT